MTYLKQSTASQEISLGQFLDSTDGDTEEGGLTIANTDIKIRKAGATTLANKNSGGATYISNGVYYAVLDATDTNTLGSGEIYVHVAGALAVKVEFCVVTANWHDTMFSTDQLDVNVTNISGTAQTANDNGADINTLITQIGTAGDGLTAINLPNQTMDITGSITGNLSGSVGSVTGAVGSVTADVTTDSASRTASKADVSALALDSKSDTIITNLADVPTVAEFNARTLVSADYVVTSDTIAGVTLCGTTTTNTDMRGTDSAGTAVELAKVPKSDSNVTFNATALASINAECDTAISDAGLPEGIPKNAIFNNIEFLMVDSTDFATPETGLTVTGTRSIDGAAFAGVSGAIAEVGNGIYQFDAAAADLNGDVITFKFSSAGAADTFLTIKTSS